MKKIMVSLVSVLLFATFALADNPQTTATKDKATTKDTKSTTIKSKSGHSCTKDGKTCTYGQEKSGCCKEGKEGADMKTNDDKGKK
jgi:uncharacterized protein YxeA